MSKIEIEIHHGIVIRAIIPESNRHEVDAILQQLKSKCVNGYFELVYSELVESTKKIGDKDD